MRQFLKLVLALMVALVALKLMVMALTLAFWVVVNYWYVWAICGVLTAVVFTYDVWRYPICHQCGHNRHNVRIRPNVTECQVHGRIIHIDPKDVRVLS